MKPNKCELKQKDYYYNPREFRGSYRSFKQKKRFNSIISKLIILLIGFTLGIASCLISLFVFTDITTTFINIIHAWLYGFGAFRQ